MAKIIGIRCDNCNATVSDYGTHCTRCSFPYSPEVLLMGEEHHASMLTLVKHKVDADEAVSVLAKSSQSSSPSPQGSGLFAKIRYYLSEFYIKKK